MAEVLQARAALRDLDEIWDYIARDNPGAASRLIERIAERCHLYAGQPMLGAACPQLAPDLRQFSVGNYVVFYQPQDDGILVVRVLHSARDIPSVFGEEVAD